MVISLPDSVHSSAEVLAAEAGFTTVEDYLVDLVGRDLERRRHEDPDWLLRRAMAEDNGPVAVSEEVIQKRKQEIEAQLMEGLRSGPATPMKAKDWTALRQRVEARLATRDEP